MTRKGYSDEADYYSQGFEKEGVVSVWVGLRGDKGDSEVDVLQDLCGVGYYRLDDQESNNFDFKLVDLRVLLADLSYSESFIEAVLNAAKSKGLVDARWVVAQYNFQYDPSKVSRTIADDSKFVGYFPYDDKL
jgi:hypothetical protein